MFEIRKTYLFICCLFVAQNIWAVGLMNRPSQINGDVLPEGLWMTAYDLSQSSKMTSQFDAYGEDVSFLKDMTKTLDIAELLDNVDDPNERALARAAFGANGLRANDIAGIVKNDLKLQYSSKTFVLGYGVSKDFTLFFAAPSVRVETQIESHIDYSAGIKNMIASLKEQGQITRAEEIETKSKTILEQQFEKYNYDEDYIDSWEGVPNFYLISRWAPPALRKRHLSFETTLVLPNEHDRYQNQFMPMQFFEESVSGIASLYYSKEVLNRLTFAAFTSYQARTRFRKDVRVPEDEDSPFSDDQENLRVKFGDEWATGLQFSYLISNWATPFTGLVYRQKASDQYGGDLYASSRYDYLEKATSQNMTVATAGVTLNSVDAFLKGKFLIPIQVTASYSDVLAGQNVFSSQVFALNFMMFYKNL